MLASPELQDFYEQVGPLTWTKRPHLGISGRTSGHSVSRAAAVFHLDLVDVVDGLAHLGERTAGALLQGILTGYNTWN